MSPTKTLLPDTPARLSAGQPQPAGRAARGGRRRRSMEVVAGIGLVTLWVSSGPLLGLGFVGVVLFGVLLLGAFQTLVRRRPLRSLTARDTASFAHNWVGKVLVPVVLVGIPAAMVLSSVAGDRYGRYADDSWKALLMLAVLAGHLPDLTSAGAHRAGGLPDRCRRLLGDVPEPGSRPKR